MDCFVSRVIEPEEYASLTDDELYNLIKDGLYVNEATVDGEYRHKHTAEHLERVVYVCPACGLSTFESHNDVIACKKCGLKARYLPTKELVGIDCDFPYHFVNEWYEAQNDFINSLDPASLTDAPIWTETAGFSEVIPYKKKRPISDSCSVELFGDKIVLKGDGVEETFLFSESPAVTVLGKNKVNVYYGDKIYQLKGSKSFNAIKFVHFYNRFRNVMKGDTNVKFLGL